MSITTSETASGSRTFDIPVTSSVDAAQKLARIHRANDLLADSPVVPFASPIGLATKPEPDMSEPGGFIGPYQQNQQYIDNGQYEKVDPTYVVPPPPQPQAPALNTHPSVQPGVTAQPQNSAPSSPKPVQPGVTVQPSQTAPAPEPLLKEATYKGPTMFDIGNGAPPDQAEGQPWVVQDPNLGKITNTIVAGTGGQTVDSIIEKPNGQTVTLRRVADGMGGYTMWMNAGGVMSVSYSPGTHGTAPGHILQYSMAEGDDPSNPSIISDLMDGGRTTVNLDTRTGTTWGTENLDNGEQEISILSQDQVQKIFRTYHDEMGNPYTEQVGELRPDKTGWYLGTDGLRRDFNPDHSIDVSGMDSTRTTARLHYTPSGQLSGTLANDVEARTITITPNDTGSIHVTQDFRGKTLHVTRYDLKGNPLRDWALGSDGKWLDYTRNADGSTTFNQLDGTKLQVKDTWHYTVWSPDGSHKDYDTSPKVDTRSFTQKLWDAGDNAWDAAFEKGRGLVIGLGAMSGFNSQYNDFAKFMGWDSRLETQKIPFTNQDMKAGPLLGLTYGMATGILKGVFDTFSADFRTVVSAAEATGDWARGKVSFNDAAVRVWQEAAFDSINARSQFFLMTDLRGATEHPSQTAGELAFGGLTLLLPTKGIGRGIGATTRAGISGAVKATELADTAIHAFKRLSIADSSILRPSREQLAGAARAATQSANLGSAAVARSMSQTLDKFRTSRNELLNRLPSRADGLETPRRDMWIDDSGRTAPRPRNPDAAEANITGIVQLDSWIKSQWKAWTSGGPPWGGLQPAFAGAPQRYARYPIRSNSLTPGIFESRAGNAGNSHAITPGSGSSGTGSGLSRRQLSAGGLSDELTNIINNAELPPRPYSQLGESVPWEKLKRSPAEKSVITGDHIPSGRSLIERARIDALKEHAKTDPRLKMLLEQREAGLIKPGNKKELREKEEAIFQKEGLTVKGGKLGPKAKEIYDQALTVVIETELHKLGRTYLGENRKKETDVTPVRVRYGNDARNPIEAVRKDLKRYLDVIPGTEWFTKQQVEAFIRHYKNLIDEKVIDSSPAIDRMLLTAWNKAG
ncbi:hypothetical protein JMUB6875_23550 [Nocardia sp. JMUB6875]|uniref:hypothetical protein n=1 Tax=Nocardia sp. JMUB6875 TaxID=3158170 RepID=UPI0032E5F35D